MLANIPPGLEDIDQDNEESPLPGETVRYPGETHLNFIDKTPFLCINEGIGIYRLIDFFRVIVMV